MGVTIQLDVFTSTLKWYYLFFSVLIKLNLEISSSFVLSSPRIQCRSSMMGFLRLTPLWKIHKVKVASKVADYKNLLLGGCKTCPFFSHQPIGKMNGESQFVQKS